MSYFISLVKTSDSSFLELLPMVISRVTLCNAACQVKLQAGLCTKQIGEKTLIPGTMFLTKHVVENKSDTHHTKNIEMALEYVVCGNVLHNSNSILE